MKNTEEKLNVTIVDKDELKQLCKDRLDFGFDSIYFRYASTVDELAQYKMLDSSNRHYKDKEYWDEWANNHKGHFYTVLEQLTHAHDKEDGRHGINY